MNALIFGYFALNAGLWLLAYHIYSLFHGQHHPIKRFLTFIILILHAMAIVRIMFFDLYPDAIARIANIYILLYWFAGALPHYCALRRFARQRVRRERLMHLQ
jgi:hypothetical protein